MLGLGGSMVRLGAMAVLAVSLLAYAPVRGAQAAAAAAPLLPTCDPVEQPDEQGRMLVRIALDNLSRKAVKVVELRIFSTIFGSGYKTGDMPSYETFYYSIPAMGSVQRFETVQAPPGYTGRRFDSLGCDAARVEYADGTRWP